MAKKSNSQSTHYLNLTILLILALAFFYPLVQGRTLFFGDTLLQRIPSMVFWKQQITAGQLPLWNPYIFAGLPHLADLSTNTLSPFNLAYLFISNPYQALSILVVLEVFLASAFMYAFLTHQKLLPTPALLGAIAFAFSGTTLAAANDINSLQGIILIPFVMLAASRLVGQPTLNHSALLSLSLTFQFLSGHPQYSYYTWVLTSFYLLVFLKEKLSSKLKIITLVFALFLGLSAVQLLPFLELSTLTYRPSNSDFSSQNSLQFLDLPRFILADIYGNWQTGSSWGPNSPLETGRATTEGFLGITSLVLAGIAVVKTKSLSAKFFAIATLISFFLAFGPGTPLFYLTRLLPLFSKFRSPIRILSLYTFSLSILAAYGLQWLINHRQHVKS